MAEAAIPGYCTFCRSRCGTLNTVVDGRLVAIAPLPGHPTGGAICPKGRAAPEIVHSSRRLTTPLRRTAPKDADDPGWEPISWDEALDTIASRLGAIRETYGPEAVGFALTSPSATPMVDSVEWVERFSAVFGSPNVCNGTEICNWHKDVAHAFTFGCAMPLPDFARTDLVILWGHNPASVWLSAAGELAEARRRGARLAAIDPRRTGHAADADYWLRIRPGTDAALALCLSHLLIASGQVDWGFVRSWTNGPMLVGPDGRFIRDSNGRFLVFDTETGLRPYDPSLSADANAVHLLALTGKITVAGQPCRPAFDLFAERAAAYPVDRTAVLTGIPAEAIHALATAIGTSRAVSYYGWTGIGQGRNATQTDRAIATLYALTGCFDRAGGNVVGSRHAAGRISDPALLPEAQRRKALGMADRPLGPAAAGMVTSRELYRAMLDHQPYRIRALMTFGANLLVSRPDPEMARQAFAALQFSVHCDLFETPTARLADILLPVSSPFERDALKIGFDVTEAAREHIQLRPAMVPPAGDVRSDAEIVCALARRLDLPDKLLQGGVEAGWRHMLHPLGITLEALRGAPAGMRRALDHPTRSYAMDQDGKTRGFATESGRVELYSERLRRAGYDPLPVAMTTPADVRFPLLLLSAKAAMYCHSQHRSITSLRQRAREPSAAISRAAAITHGIVAGDWVWIQTRAGQARFRAQVDDALADDIVSAEFGWWQAAPDLGLQGYDPTGTAGSSFNRLIDSDEVDPVSGSTPLKQFACALRRDGAPGWEGWRHLVVSAHDIRRGVSVVDFVATDHGALPHYQPGQHLCIRTEIPGIGLVTRAYTLCGPAGLGAFRIAVRTLPEGVFSSVCREVLAPGREIEACAPAGTFILPTAADFPVVLMTGGIGVTPALAYLESLVHVPNPPEVTLYVGYRDGRDHVFAQRLACLASRIGSVRIVTQYSGTRGAGRLTADSADASLIQRRARFYLCGPLAMMAELTAGLIRRGVPPFEIFREAFRSPPVPNPAAAGPFAVVLNRSRVTLTWQPGCGTLLDLAERAGLAWPSGCRVGSCESCAASILRGEVRHSAAAVHVPDGVCLTCQGVPVSDLVIDM